MAYWFHDDAERDVGRICMLLSLRDVSLVSIFTILMKDSGARQEPQLQTAQRSPAIDLLLRAQNQDTSYMCARHRSIRIAGCRSAFVLLPSQATSSAVELSLSYSEAEARLVSLH